MHKRTAVRKAFEAALTGLASTGSRVVSGELHTRRQSGLPGLSLAFAQGGGETVAAEIDDERGDIHVRALPVSVRAIVAVSDTYLDELDDICLEVETAAHADAGVAGVALQVSLLSTAIETSGEGETPVAAATMDWRILYVVNEKAPAA